MKLYFPIYLLSLMGTCFPLSDYVKVMIKENKLKSTPYKRPEAYIKPKEWPSNKTTACWLGHATVLIKIAGKYIITDPVLYKRIGPPELFNNAFGIRRIIRLPLKSLTDLPNIDLILISHNHYDHLDLPSIEKIFSQQKRKPKLIIPNRSTYIFKDTSHKPIELDWRKNKNTQYKADNLLITAFRVEHYSQVPGTVRDKSAGFNGYLIQHQNTTIAFFGDTSYKKWRNHLGQWTGKTTSVDWKKQTYINSKQITSIDLAIIPIGDFYYKNHTSPKEAVQIAKAINAKKLLPIHYDTFILSPPDKYTKTAKELLLQGLKRNNNLKLIQFNKNKQYPDVGVTLTIK